MFCLINTTKGSFTKALYRVEFQCKPVEINTGVTINDKC